VHAAQRLSYTCSAHHLHTFISCGFHWPLPLGTHPFSAHHAVLFGASPLGTHATASYPAVLCPAVLCSVLEERARVLGRQLSRLPVSMAETGDIPVSEKRIMQVVGWVGGGWGTRVRSTTSLPAL